MSKSAVPVVPGKQGQYDIKSGKTGDPCAACGEAGDYRMKRELRVVQGVRIMLCFDALACGQRYRSGLKPDAYAAMMRRGEKP